MRAKTLLAAFILFLFAASLPGGQEKTAQKGDQGEGKSLIRKELLLKEKKELQPPRRNIFSPRKAELRQPESEGIGMPEGLQKNAESIGSEAARAPLSLSYIGYIISGEKIIALIVLEGDILYVEKGDMIGEGIKIGEVTPAEIEVIGPGSEKKKYLIQGDSK
jgi:hypothetical protein